MPFLMLCDDTMTAITPPQQTEAMMTTTAITPHPQTEDTETMTQTMKGANTPGTTTRKVAQAVAAPKHVTMTTTAITPPQKVAQAVAAPKHTAETATMEKRCQKRLIYDSSDMDSSEEEEEEKRKRRRVRTTLQRTGKRSAPSPMPKKKKPGKKRKTKEQISEEADAIAAAKALEKIAISAAVADADIEGKLALPDNMMDASIVAGLNRGSGSPFCKKLGFLFFVAEVTGNNIFDFVHKDSNEDNGKCPKSLNVSNKYSVPMLPRMTPSIKEIVYGYYTFVEEHYAQVSNEVMSRREYLSKGLPLDLNHEQKLRHLLEARNILWGYWVCTEGSNATDMRSEIIAEICKNLPGAKNNAEFDQLRQDYIEQGKIDAAERDEEREQEEGSHEVEEEEERSDDLTVDNSEQEEEERSDDKIVVETVYSEQEDEDEMLHETREGTDDDDGDDASDNNGDGDDNNDEGCGKADDADDADDNDDGDENEETKAKEGKEDSQKIIEGTEEEEVTKLPGGEGVGNTEEGTATTTTRTPLLSLPLADADNGGGKQGPCVHSGSDRDSDSDSEQSEYSKSSNDGSSHSADGVARRIARRRAPKRDVNIKKNDVNIKKAVEDKKPKPKRYINTTAVGQAVDNKPTPKKKGGVKINSGLITNVDSSGLEIGGNKLKNNELLGTDHLLSEKYNVGQEAAIYAAICDPSIDHRRLALRGIDSVINAVFTASGDDGWDKSAEKKIDKLKSIIAKKQFQRTKERVKAYSSLMDIWEKHQYTENLGEIKGNPPKHSKGNVYDEGGCHFVEVARDAFQVGKAFLAMAEKDGIGPLRCHWEFDLMEACDLIHTNGNTPTAQERMFAILVCIVLSAATKDRKCIDATVKLKKALGGLTPTLVANANCDTVSEAIRSAGIHMRKAEYLIILAEKIVSEFNGMVPDNFEVLLSFKGISHKTGTIIMQEGYCHILGVPVDLHVSQVSVALGFYWPKNGKRIQKKSKWKVVVDTVHVEHSLRTIFEEKDYKDINMVMGGMAQLLTQTVPLRTELAEMGVDLDDEVAQVQAAVSTIVRCNFTEPYEQELLWYMIATIRDHYGGDEEEDSDSDEEKE